MQRQRSRILAALLLTVAAGHASAQAPAPGGQPGQGQQPVQQPQQGQQPVFVPPPPPRVVPGLPTVELAPLLERVARASNKRFLVDGRIGPQIYLAGAEANDVAYPVLLSILRANGLAAVEIEGRVNIIPEADVRAYPTPIAQTDDASIPADEFVTRVVTVTNIEGPLLIPVLRPLLPVSAHLAGIAPNKVLIVDRYANVKRITEVIRSLDVPPRN